MLLLLHEVKEYLVYIFLNLISFVIVPTLIQEVLLTFFVARISHNPGVSAKINAGRSSLGDTWRVNIRPAMFITGCNGFKNNLSGFKSDFNGFESDFRGSDTSLVTLAQGLDTRALKSRPRLCGLIVESALRSIDSRLRELSRDCESVFWFRRSKTAVAWFPLAISSEGKGRKNLWKTVAQLKQSRYCQPCSISWRYVWIARGNAPELDGDALLHNLDITDVVIVAGNLLSTPSPFPTANSLRDVGGPYDDDGVLMLRWLFYPGNCWSCRLWGCDSSAFSTPPFLRFACRLA